jgi:4-hydroxy-tetrahydrodipicolinate synthase
MRMRTEKLRGFWVASLTPLTADDRIDVALFARHCRWLFEQGCDGVAVFGTTGEGQSFSVRERMEALDGLLAAGIPGDRIVVGTGCAAVPDAVELTRHALASDVAAAMVLPPFFWKGQSQETVANGIGRVIELVADPALRVVLYHIPQVSAVAIDAGAIAILRERFGAVVAGIKDSSADFTHYDVALSQFPEMLHFVGAEAQLPRALEIGGAGTICGLGNVAPRAMAELRDRRAAAGDAIRQIESLCRLFATRPFLQTTRGLLAGLAGEAAWLRTRAPLIALNEAAAAEAALLARDILGARTAA